MKKTYKVFVPVLGLLIITPSIALASWWNPTSWNWFGLFQQHKTSTAVQISIPTPKKVNLKILNNAQIIEKVKPAVVYIETSKSIGSGMFIESNATGTIILTNAHVVKGSNTAQITLSDSSMYSATVIGRDEDIDLALLKISAANKPVVELGDANSPAQGDSVFALGYPFGIKADASFTSGVVSRLLNDGKADYIEMSVDIHPGNSGGPLVNQYGQVIGINTAIYGDSVSGVQVGETIKLAIPIKIAENVIPALKAGKKVVLSVDQPKPQTQKSIPSNNPANSVVTFEEKNVCASYTDKIKGQIIEMNASSKMNSKKGAGMTLTFGEMFFSPITNSCLYTQTVFMDWSWAIGTQFANGTDVDHHTVVTYEIYDYLADKVIWSAVIPNKISVGDLLKGSVQRDEFDKEIDHLKGN